MLYNTDQGVVSGGKQLYGNLVSFTWDLNAQHVHIVHGNPKHSFTRTVELEEVCHFVNKYLPGKLRPQEQATAI